ncbi:MAG: SurA N-terminal domain-containing protein, partial [Spirochaetales bacterium]|nr:SurA N-terminal domain-containing protein [Spirochaetales bacterium]
MKKLFLLLLIAVVFGCNNSSNVIAKVGKESISQEQFDIEVAKLTKAMVPEDYVMTDDEKLQFESQILNNLIMKIVYTKEMDKR